MATDRSTDVSKSACWLVAIDCSVTLGAVKNKTRDTTTIAISMITTIVIIRAKGTIRLGLYLFAITTTIVPLNYRVNLCTSIDYCEKSILLFAGAAVAAVATLSGG